MSDRQDVDGRIESEEPTVDRTGTIEAYEVDGGVVLHDAENPFAWLESGEAVDLYESV